MLFAGRVLAVKLEYGLTVDPTEADALEAMLALDRSASPAAIVGVIWLLRSVHTAELIQNVEYVGGGSRRPTEGALEFCAALRVSRGT